MRQDLASKRSSTDQLRKLDAAHLEAKKERSKLFVSRVPPAASEVQAVQRPAPRAKKGKKARKAAAAS